MNQDELKRQAAMAALEYVKPGMLLGIGTGSTMNHFIDLLAEKNIPLEGTVASSEQSAERLQKHGIQVKELNDANTLDLYIDGADEVDQHGRLIKGGGAALTREKIVCSAAKSFVCIVDSSKMVKVLGKFPLPVEVIPMARSLVARKIVTLGGQPVYRNSVVTDNGNVILDINNLSITDPSTLEQVLNQIPGVVCNGIFADNRPGVVIEATTKGVQTHSFTE